MYDLAQEPRFVFINNEPVAVLLDIQEYERYFFRPTLQELLGHEVTMPLKKAAARARKSKKQDLLNL